MINPERGHGTKLVAEFFMSHSTTLITPLIKISWRRAGGITHPSKSLWFFSSLSLFHGFLLLLVVVEVDSLRVSAVTGDFLRAEQSEIGGFVLKPTNLGIKCDRYVVYHSTWKIPLMCSIRGFMEIVWSFVAKAAILIYLQIRNGCYPFGFTWLQALYFFFILELSWK